jgi:hypothetical protein
MIKFIAIMMICFGYLIVHKVQAGYDEDVAAINKGVPKQVKLFNKRQIDCNHWAGEEPYDKERAKEINAAITKLRCDALDRDEKRLRKKYKTRPNVINSINKAKEFI